MRRRTVKYLFENIDAGVFPVLLNSVRPKNRILGVELPDIMHWRFCDVMEFISCVNNLTPFEVAEKALSYHSKVDERGLLKCDSNEFMCFLKHVKKEVEKIAILQDALRSDPKADLVNAGIDNLNKFGQTTIYYAISKNPLEWDKISEIPYAKMYTKMMIDKTQADIQERYNEILTEKSKQR